MHREYGFSEDFPQFPGERSRTLWAVIEATEVTCFDQIFEICLSRVAFGYPVGMEELTEDDLDLIDAELDKRLHTWLFYRACEQTSFLLSIAYAKP